MADKKRQKDDSGGERRYYMLDLRPGLDGVAHWWLPDRAGITTDLDAAWIVGERLARNRQAWEASCPVPVALARRAATTQVCVAQLRALADQQGVVLPGLI